MHSDACLNVLFLLLLCLIYLLMQNIPFSAKNANAAKHKDILQKRTMATGQQEQTVL